MKFSFFKKRREREEIRLRCAMLEQEKDDLIKSLAEVRLSKDRKIENLIDELSLLRHSSEKEKQSYEERVKLYADMYESRKETCDKQSKEIEKLEKRNWELKLLIPTEFPIDELMSTCATSAWNGYRSTTKRTFESLDGKVKLFFEGTVYEPSWEYFTAGCCVYYQEEGMEKRKSLYTIDSRNVDSYKNEEVETGSREAIREYLVRKNLGFREV